MTDHGTLAGHGVEVCSNRGWDDDPDWALTCSCAWETWNHLTEESARERHNEHRAEIALYGICGCDTCTLERSEGVSS